MHTLTQLTLAFELSEQGLSHTKIAAHLGRHRETYRAMAEGHSGVGAIGFSRAPYAGQERPSTGSPGPSHDQALDPGAYTRTRLLWAEDRVFPGAGVACPFSVPKIDEILAEKNVTRSKWRKNQRQGAVPKASCARAVIQNG
jgi:hypothetical protein